MNLRPSGYEPDELPGCSTPRYGAGSRGRTGTILTYHGILSPGRLPIPPFRHFATVFRNRPYSITPKCGFVNPFLRFCLFFPFYECSAVFLSPLYAVFFVLCKKVLLFFGLTGRVFCGMISTALKTSFAGISKRSQCKRGKNS